MPNYSRCISKLWFFIHVISAVHWQIARRQCKDGLSPEVSDERIHNHIQAITAKDIKGSNAPSNRDVDVTYATSSSEAAGTSSEHERVNIGHGNETSLGDPEQQTLPMEFDSSRLNLTLELWCTRYKRSLFPAQYSTGEIGSV